MSSFSDFLDRLTETERSRAIPLPAAADYGPISTLTTGHSQDLFSPTIYGDYVATSNDVYSAAMLRAKSLAKLTLDYLDRTGAKLDDGGAVEQLLSFVNPHWTQKRMLVMYELSMTLWGQCYWVIESSTGGVPRELWWVKPTRMRPIVSKSAYIAGYEYSPPGGGAPIVFAPEEILWFRYPNVIDEFSGLAPMAAARLAADFSSSAMHTNQRLFDQGLMLGGVFSPSDPEVVISPEQAEELEKKLATRFQGADKAHRWGVSGPQSKFETLGVTPSDANFVEGINLSFRQVCRALGVPAPLLGDGEFATLANLSVYERQLSEHTMQFEAAFLADELNEQLLPRFRATQVAAVEFDLSTIAVLQDDLDTKEQREAAQIADGRITINEWRAEKGYEPVPWGDVAWLSWNLVPVADASGGAGTKTSVEEATVATQGYGVRAVDPFRNEEDRFARLVERLIARQLDSVISTIKRTVNDAADAPFDLAKWIAEYERESRPVLYATVQAGAKNAADAVGVPVDDLGLGQKLATEADRLTVEFARRANETLFADLRDAIASGLAEDGSVESVVSSVRRVLGPDAAEWRPRRIAATETTKSTSFGQMEVFRATGVTGKRWVTQNDSKVRDTHRTLHNSVVDIDDAFVVGGCIADAPGLSGCPEEDINCRCRVEPVRSRSAVISSLQVLRDALGDD